MTFTYLQQSFFRTKRALNSRQKKFPIVLIVTILQHSNEHNSAHSDHQGIFNNGYCTHRQIKYVIKTCTPDFFLI